MNKFVANMPISKIDKQRRLIAGYASVEVVDRDGEVVKKEALRRALSEYLRNPIIRWMHEEVPIGKVVDAQVDDKGLYVTAYITDKTEKGREAWALIEEGILKAFSIGGNIKKKVYEKMADGREVGVIADLDLYEISVVDVPANPESFFEVIAKKAREMDMDKSADVEKAKPKVSNGPWNPPSTQEERQKLKEKCGARAFLLPGELKFPVMNSDCSYNLNGIRAAIRRAAQYGHRDVEERARRLLERLSPEKSVDVQLEKAVEGDNMAEEQKVEQPQPAPEVQKQAPEKAEEPKPEPVQTEEQKPAEEQAQEEPKEASANEELRKVYSELLKKVEAIEKKLEERKGLVAEDVVEKRNISKEIGLGEALVKLAKMR